MNHSITPIIIGAGRGSRLKSMTDDQPKCYATIGSRRILDWTLEAFAGAGLKDPVFIGGYQIDRIKRDYPHLKFRHNDNWQNNNILASLFYAEQDMSNGFICTYSDILFRNSIVKGALEHPGDVVLCVDTHWRDRYQDRSQHPEHDAEKVTRNSDVVTRIDRELSSDEADGEYIGVARLSARGAELFKQHYHRVRKDFAGKPWRQAKVFEKAYLILLFQEMIEQGITVNLVTTHGDYMEVDTEEDYVLANRDWSHMGRNRKAGI